MTATLKRGKTIDDPVYLEAEGDTWRVYDARFEDRRWRTTPLPSSRATNRLFVNAKGVRRSYAFTKGEDRQLSATALEAQLRRAKYLASKESKEIDHGTIGGPPPGEGR